MSIWIRAVTYASLFIAFVLVFVPAGILARTGITAPASIGAVQVIGAVLVVIGGAIARRTFGSEYEEYSGNVRRWLPRL